MAVFDTQTEVERKQLDALKAHQRSVREHVRAQERVDALAEALTDAQQDHVEAKTARASAKNTLLSALRDA